MNVHYPRVVLYQFAQIDPLAEMKKSADAVPDRPVVAPRQKG